MKMGIRLTPSVLFSVLVVSILAIGAEADVARIAYSFAKDKGGGVAVVDVDVQTGRIVKQQALFQSADCKQPVKVRRSTDGKTLVVANEASDGPHLFIVRDRAGGEAQSVKLSDVPDDVGLAGDYALATCADDSLALVDLRNSKLAAQWSAEDELTPPGNKPEGVLVLPGEHSALVSFQKDSKKGKKFGSRLALLTLPELELQADLQLPRDHPQLHIQGNLQQQGPSPEVMLLAESANTLVVTLDLYGAVALMDWRDASDGKLTRCQYLPTSLDGSWGTAFPDRANLLHIGERSYAFVCNAGPQGGTVLIDVTGREIVRKWKVPPGLEKPAFLPRAQLAVSVCSGKTKHRTDSDVEKTYHPRKEIYVFSFSENSDLSQSPVKTLDLKVFAVGIAPVQPDHCPLVLMAIGQSEQADTLVVFDPVSREFKDRQPAEGVIARFEGY